MDAFIVDNGSVWICWTYGSVLDSSVIYCHERGKATIPVEIYLLPIVIFGGGGEGLDGEFALL